MLFCTKSDWVGFVGKAVIFSLSATVAGFFGISRLGSLMMPLIAFAQLVNASRVGHPRIEKKRTDREVQCALGVWVPV